MNWGYTSIKAIAVSVRDFDRAFHFYTKKLGLKPARLDGEVAGVRLGRTILLLKPKWNRPTRNPNFRLTLEVQDARATARVLKARGVKLADRVVSFGTGWLGSFLDSEGNKFWFCSTNGKR